MEQAKLEAGYDVISEIVAILECDLITEYGMLNYKKVQTLAAAYTLQEYLANELAAFPDEEGLDS